MDSSHSVSSLPNAPIGSAQSTSSRSRSSTKIVDDVTSLTSFNPFSEEDENEQSSYALVTSLFSKVRNTLAAPLSSAVASSSTATTSAAPITYQTEQRRPSFHNTASGTSAKSADRRPIHVAATSKPAAPLVSLTPVVSETPFYGIEHERPSSRNGSLYTPDTPEGGPYGTAIPGFPIQDSDARSIRTTGSIRRSASVSKVIRRIRGEGLSRDYWMDDELCKECYDCRSMFTAWRRKHHCRICGQVFCSRCASNIIKGTRFGHDGMVRVCNLCLEKLAKVEDDDDDDRRSISSNITSPFAAHQLGESVSWSLGHHSQSPFAASQLFGRPEPFNLFSIAETRPYSGYDESPSPSRPGTPDEDSEEDRVIRDGPAPFRRALTQEEKDSMLPDKFNNDLHQGPGNKTPMEFPVTVPVSADPSTSTVQFPIGSPDQGHGESPGFLRSRFNSYADLDVAPHFIRSRVQSRLGDLFGLGESGWRTRRESTAYAQELNLISMFHLRIMLRQMLTSEDIPNIAEWEETLMKLALRIARELTFTAHPNRQGADMDVRRYVKIKKIPGGTPKDSEYVDGAVITKNIAHKRMLRTQRNPRVMLVTFPLEFHRVEGQYMHFSQIFRQEKEYLGNLASRIAALRPHVVLAEKSVSRLALDALTKHNIAVARSVKPSAIQFVARMTQGDVFSSMDKLALEPRLGHCARFRIQTFDHALIPGQRKSYMRLEGCNGEMGCTILLRGGDINTLKRVKKVTRFLAFIVRNLKLETHLWKDSIITLPSLTAEATPPPYGSKVTSPVSFPPMSVSASLQRLLAQPLGTVAGATVELHRTPHNVDDLPDEDADQMRLSKRIEESVEPYRRTFISVSATLRFPPPYPIRRMKELDDELVHVKREWEDEIIRREEKAPYKHRQEETITQMRKLEVDTSQPDSDDVAAQIESLEIPDMDMAKTPMPGDDSPPEPTPGYFDFNLSHLSQISGPSIFATSPVPLLPSPEEPAPLKTAEDIRLESRLNYVHWQHAEFRRIWEWYLRKNRDDFDVEKYQCISLWEATLPMTESGLHRSCHPPQFKYMTFYGENDCTLGQFIEQSAIKTIALLRDSKAICENKTCGQPLARHCKLYVHNETRMTVAVEQWNGQISKIAQDTIITWSACRVCGSATPFIPVSPEMQRYSFAKFLELHFYPADVQLVQGAGCIHNIYQHHIRFFAVGDMTVRFQTDPVVLHEIVYPPVRIRVRPESQLDIKNVDFQRLHRRNNLWYTALVDDLKLITIDAATGDEEADARLTAQVNALIARAEWEKADIAKLLNQIYKETSPTDTLALNQARAYRQDKIVAWQQDFDKLPKPRAMDRSSRKASAFGTVRSMWPKRTEVYGPYGTLGTYAVPSSTVSEAEDNSVPIRRVTVESLTSSASDASETEETVDKGEETRPVLETNSIITSDLSSLPPMPKETSKSDGDSDSTIGARCGEALSSEVSPPVPMVQGDDMAQESLISHISRLPRRPSNYPSVAELVKRYQDFLPPQGVEELTKTALAPGIPIDDSEPEAVPTVRPRIRSKGKRQLLSKKSSISDFEQGYAANVAPRYLTHSRRPLTQGNLHNTRIPGPVASSFESQEPSRRPSPDKRVASVNLDLSSRIIKPSSSPADRVTFGAPLGRRRSVKAGQRSTTGDKVQARPASSGGPKSTLRRQPPPGSKVGNITKHFERISKDNEKASRRYAVIRGRKPRPVASARAKVEVLDSIKDAIQDESESSDSSEADDEGGDEDESAPKPDTVKVEVAPGIESTADTNIDLDAASGEILPRVPSGSQIPATYQTDPPSVQVDGPTPSAPGSPLLPAITHEAPDLPTPSPEAEGVPSGLERHSILKALSGFWPQQLPATRGRLDPDMDDPMSDPEHIFRNSSMVVRTDEPTSIIALALNSPQYRDLLARSRAEKRQSKEPKVADGSGEAFMPDDKSVAESTSTWGVVNVDSSEGGDPTEELRVPSSKQPWAISFESGGLTISCTVLFPEQFDALRRTYDCEKSMVESLARCVKWNASGGKSGSAFLKTLDDRFIAKELSRAELQAMETFAPAYFDYMSSAVVANRPTLLAKIFGCFKITFRKSHKHQSSSRSKVTQMNLLVMENLFYDRRFFKIYDLKGSTRNRHVQSTGRENEVLLDENLVETQHLAPFYLREHSKRILRGALFNDSKFLADINVMDYSLVVGVDSMKNELVVGVVDYIRTYTWDKKLESWVKDSAFLGGGANKGEPTIIGPKQYRQRFLSAMERYFPLVPDRWMKQHDAPEEDGNNLLELWPDW